MIEQKDDSWKYSGTCAVCGHCIDDHMCSELSIEEENNVLDGYKKSLNQCTKYKIKPSDLKEVIYSTARRLFLQEDNITKYFCDGRKILSEAKKLLKQNESEWKEEIKYNMYYGGGSVVSIYNPNTGETMIAYSE